MKKEKNNEIKAVNTPLKHTPVTYGLILRGLPDDLQELIEFLEQTKISTIYKHASYGKLYIFEGDEKICQK